jgi:hypothetical protein
MTETRETYDAGGSDLEQKACVWTRAFYKSCVQTAYNTNCGHEGARADSDEDLEQWAFCPYCGRRLARK